MLTERQELILKKIIQDYIKLARPISSEYLERKHKLGISSATIRIEFKKLTEQKYLEKPHISAGRIPTDKAYRFFVNSIFEGKVKEVEMDDLIKKEIEEIEEKKDEMKFLQSLIKEISELSKTLVVSYLKKREIFLKEGLENLLREPEFFEKKILFSFFDFLESFEKEIENLKLNSEIKVFIGKENPFGNWKDFSLIITKCYLSNHEETIFSLVGPKRMDYNKGIGILDSLRKCLKSYERRRIKKRD